MSAARGCVGGDLAVVLKAQGPSRFCNESKEEEDVRGARGAVPDCAARTQAEESQGLLVSLAREESLKEAAIQQATSGKKSVQDLTKQVIPTPNANDLNSSSQQKHTVPGHCAPWDCVVCEPPESSDSLPVSLAREESLKEAAIQQATSGKKSVQDLSKQAFSPSTVSTGVPRS